MYVLLQPATGEQCQYEDCPTSACADTPGGAHSTPLLRQLGHPQNPSCQPHELGGKPPNSQLPLLQVTGRFELTQTP
jgi:hypothetical protein